MLIICYTDGLLLDRLALATFDARCARHFSKKGSHLQLFERQASSAVIEVHSTNVELFVGDGVGLKVGD